MNTQRQILPEGVELKQIPQYPEHSISECGQYLVNLKGKVLVQSAQVIKGKPTGYIYATVLASDYTYSQRVAVHRLVAFAWLGSAPTDKHVWSNHKDGNKSNNNASNLEWTTISQNIQHAIDTGLKVVKKGIESPLYGHKHSLKTKSLMREQKLGRNHPKWKGDYIVLGKRYHSANQAGKAIGVDAGTIHRRANNPKLLDYSFIPRHIVKTEITVEHISKSETI
jgi:hypothetical protein